MFEIRITRRFWHAFLQRLVGEDDSYAEIKTAS